MYIHVLQAPFVDGCVAGGIRPGAYIIHETKIMSPRQSDCWRSYGTKRGGWLHGFFSRGVHVEQLTICNGDTVHGIDREEQGFFSCTLIIH